MATKKKAPNAKPAAKKAAKKSAVKAAPKSAKKAINKPLKARNLTSHTVSRTPLKAANPTAKKKTVKKQVKAKPVVAKKTAPKSKAQKVVAKKVVTKKVIAPKKVVKAVKKVVAKPAPVKKPVQKVIAKKAIAKPIVKPLKAKSTPVVVKPELPVSKPVFAPKAQLSIPKARIINVEKNLDTRSRYSDAELKEFKVLVENKLADARVELVNLNATVINANENGTDDTGASFKMLEDGSDTLAKEESAQLAIRQRKFIEQLEAALQRINNKTYGICRVTGKLIAKERLRAVPHTTQSMEAKLKQYRD